MPMTVPELELSLLRGPTATVVRVGGDVDLATADQLRQRLLDAADQLPAVVHLDLRAVDFIDSAGIHAVLDGADRAAAVGGHLGVVAASPPVRHLLALTGLAVLPPRPTFPCRPVRVDR